ILVKDPDADAALIARLTDDTAARGSRGRSETNTLKRSDTGGPLLLEKTKRQVLGEFFVAAAAFHEGRDGEPGAKYRLAPENCWRPGKPDPRLPIADPQVIVVQSLVAELRGSVHARRGVNRPGVEPKVNDLVGRFVERSMVFEAQPEVHGERWSHAPVILYKPSENIAPKLGRRTELAAGIPLRGGSPLNVAQPEVSKARARRGT